MVWSKEFYTTDDLGWANRNPLFRAAATRTDKRTDEISTEAQTLPTVLQEKEHQFIIVTEYRYSNEIMGHFTSSI
jgi:hypothetical protein